MNMSAVPFTAGFTELHILTLGSFFYEVSFDIDFFLFFFKLQIELKTALK